MERNRIKNIWLLLLYASDLYQHLRYEQIRSTEENPDKIPGLVAEILVAAVERRLRRDLSHRYRVRSADLNRMRGSIDLLRMESKSLLLQGKIACTFEDLSVDTPPNRFVRAALVRLAKVVRQNKNAIKEYDELAIRCSSAATRLERAGVGYDESLFDSRRVFEVSTFGRLGRLDAADGEMLAAAQLAFRLDLPVEDAEAGYDKELSALFEKAVLGFYRFHAREGGWIVRGQHEQRWKVRSDTSSQSEIHKLIPVMRLDIVLEVPDRQKIIIDTKYKKITTKQNQLYGNKLVSSDLYQMYAYLRSQEDDHQQIRPVGVLLYVSDGEDMDLTINIQGYDIRFVTVNLAADSHNIRKRLLDVASMCRPNIHPVKC